MDATSSTPLTAAERAVTRGLLRGLSYEQIARERKTSVRTVANQVAASFRKLQVHSRAELVYRIHRNTRLVRQRLLREPPGLGALSERTRTVLVRRALGDSLKLIASDLDLSVSTICREFQRGMAALSLATPAELGSALVLAVAAAARPGADGAHAAKKVTMVARTRAG
jgi:DNA-binding NarL/FixJ family response regulator